MSIGRVSTNYAFIRSMQNITSAFLNMDELQEKMNTGKNINRPSDNPIGLQKVLALGTSLRENTQYQTNIDEAKSRLEAASTTLDQLESLLRDVMEIAQGSSSQIATSTERAAYAQEVELMLKELVSLANTEYRGKYVFGGSYTVSGSCAQMQPFNIEYGSDGLISGVVPNPRGINTIINTIVLPGVRDTMNISGALPLQPNGSKGIGDAFDLLVDLRNNLLANDTTALDRNAEDLQDAIEQVVEQNTIVGAKVNKLETAKTTLKAVETTEKEAKSQVEDADYARLLIEYTTAETLLNSTLRATATLLQNSLLNFI